MENTQPPPFQRPIAALDPTVQSILNENELIVERGISYSRYVPLRPVDNLELLKNSKLLNYYYKDLNCYLNTRRVFLHIQYICTKDDGNALTRDDYVSASNVMAQSMIDSCILNIGNRIASDTAPRDLFFKCAVACL